MNFMQRIFYQKPIFLLIVLGIILWISSAATLSPVQKMQAQATSVPTIIDQNPAITTSSLVETEVMQPTATPTLPSTATPFPDWAMTSKDTDGLLFAGILILLIITIGTLAAIANRTPESNHKKNR